MTDFWQAPKLYTLSNICFDESKVNLQKYFNETIVVIIPCQVRHLENNLIFNVLNQLKLISYLSEIVVVVNGSPSPAIELAQSLKMVDNRISVLLESEGSSDDLNQCFAIGSHKPAGKGFALWLGFAYVFQKYRIKAIIATIDADIQNFTPAFLLKLLYPLVEFGADINKGYYVRYSNDKLDGRLTRLLVFPLLKAMRKQINTSELIDYLIEFRYPLSGEVAINSRLLSKLNLRQAWSYDLSLLVQVQQNLLDSPVFQTEITDNYQHQHRQLSGKNDSNSLSEVAQDIINYLLTFYKFDIEVLTHDYLSIASELIDKYMKLAAFNGLNFCLAEEKELVQQFMILIMNGEDNSAILPRLDQIPCPDVVEKFISTITI